MSEPETDGHERPIRTVTAPDGRTVAYATDGDPDGDPVCFFHGTPGSRLLGALFDDLARERGLRLLAIALAASRPGIVLSVALVGSAAPPDCVVDEPLPQRLLETLLECRAQVLDYLVDAFDRS